MTVLALLAASGGWLLYRSDAFTAAEVEVVGAATVSAEEVSRVAAVPLGEPLASLDLVAIADRVSAGLPPVATATVVRRWPHTVVISVAERTPVAVVPERAGRVVVIDSAGVVIRTVSPAPPGLPRVEVTNPGPQDKRTLAALSVVEVLTPQLRTVLVAIRAPTPEQVTLVLAKGRSVFWGGADDGDKKATVATALLNRPGNAIDVSAPDVVTVK